MKTNQEPLYWVTTKNGKHIPVFDKDPKKNAEIIKAYKSKRAIEPDAYVEPFTRMANHLAKQGISNEDEIENYLKGLSATRRSKLAREMGIESRGSDKIREMAHRIYLAGKKEVTPTPPAPKPEPPKKEEPKKEPLKASEIKEMYENRNKKANTPNFPQEYESILGKKKDVDPMERLGECKTNEVINYGIHNSSAPFYKYHENCALCTCAAALQARGYDVEAMPRDKNTWRGADTIFDYDLSNPDNFILSNAKNYEDNYNLTNRIKQKFHFGSLKEEDYDKMPQGAKAVAKAVMDKVKGWGHGALGQLSVQWAGRTSSHSVVIGNDHGEVFIWDSQCNKMYLGHEFTKYFERTRAVRSQLVRLDNAPLKSGLEDILPKMVKVRDTSVNGQINKGLDKIDWSKF